MFCHIGIKSEEEQAYLSFELPVEESESVVGGKEGISARGCGGFSKGCPNVIPQVKRNKTGVASDIFIKSNYNEGKEVASNQILRGLER